MVLRIMQPLGPGDAEKLKAFADQYQVQWWLQTAWGQIVPHLTIRRHRICIICCRNLASKCRLKPTDFTQVNHHINRVLVARALVWFDVQKDERILDLFCGLGNFTLPIATMAREVMGIEGSTALTERAMENAKANGLDHKLSFATRNLF